MGKKLLSLCMIVKDENDYIKSCIESVKDIVDEIIVVDTGSVDGTIQIAESLGAKVYKFKWVNSFAKARNFAIENATAQWLLMLDADEALFKEDKETLLNFINDNSFDGAHFTVYNYVGKLEDKAYNLHNALRLLKNNKQYQFKGDIHEQIERIDGKSMTNLFAITDIRLHHYGYLDSVAQKKNKRERNIPLLLNELEKNQNDGFTLFNLGNEYMALKDYSKAAEYYDLSLQNAKKTQAYGPHLYFRKAICSQKQNKINEAIKVLNEGLHYYSGCTDMELCKGLYYAELRLDILAEKSFKKAMEMGVPHGALKFSDNCSTTRPLIALSELYLRQQAYKEAEEACKKLLAIEPTQYSALYRLAKIYLDSGDNEGVAAKKLEMFFSNITHVPNLLLLTDIMLSTGYLNNAKKYLDLIKNSEYKDYNTDARILESRWYFLNNEYEKAEQLLKNVVEGGDKPKIMLGLVNTAVSTLIALDLIYLYKNQTLELNTINYPISEVQLKVIYQSKAIIKNESESFLNGYAVQDVLDTLSLILKDILMCKEFELFEKLLYNYNFIDSNKVLLSLAKVYNECGYYGFAASAVLSSIKELSAIDLDSTKLLLDSLIKN